MESVRCRPPGLHQTTLAESLQHAVEQELLGGTSNQSAPELREDGEVEPGVRQLQGERVLPVDPSAHGVGGLAIGEILQELHDCDQRQPPRGQPRLTAHGEELGKVGVLIQDSKFIPKAEI